MMMRTAFLLCLLCMGQAAAAPFAEENAVSGSASVSAIMSPSPTDGVPIATPTPRPDSTSDSESANKGLKEGDTLLGITVFLTFLIVLGMLHRYWHPAQDTAEEEAPERSDLISDMLNDWHRAPFRFVHACLGPFGVRVICYVSALLCFALSIAGELEASGTLLGVGLIFFFVFTGLISDKKQCESLELGDSVLGLFAGSICFTVLFFSIVTPARLIDDDKADNAALALLLLLGVFLGQKALRTIMLLKERAYDPLI